MKKILLIMLCLAQSCFGDMVVSLAWNGNPKEEKVAGYKLHWGNSSGDYVNEKNLGERRIFSDRIKRNVPYYFALTAYNQQKEESDFSNEISINIEPPQFAFYKGNYSVFQGNNYISLSITESGAFTGYIYNTLYKIRTPLKGVLNEDGEALIKVKIGNRVRAVKLSIETVTNKVYLQLDKALFTLKKNCE